MSIAVQVSREGVRAGIAAARVREIVTAVCGRERVRDAMISVAFVTTRRIAALNRQHLGHAGATDVITFELGTPGAVVGDVYIAPDVARRNAREHGRPVREELVRLVIHGTLHVLGHTHDTGATAARARGSMWRRQEELVAALA